MRLPVDRPGERLDAFVIRHLQALRGGHSRQEVQGWIAEGRVSLHRGGRAPNLRPKRSHKLAAADAVEVRLPAPPAPPQPLAPEALPVPILYQDAALLVLDKPAGLTVHPGAGQRTGTLANALLHLSPGALSGLGGPERPGIVHRLDKDTSGVIVVARSDAAHRELARQFHDREVEKVYLALVDGVPREAEGTIDLPLDRHPRDRKRRAVVEGGRPALTRYRVREDLGRFALVECRPRTGRTHQLRVHLKAIGTPILADATYGPRRGRDRGAGVFTRRDAGLGGAGPLLERQALHAWRLSLRHPDSGAPVRFEAPLPTDMVDALEALRAAAP